MRIVWITVFLVCSALPTRISAANALAPAEPGAAVELVVDGKPNYAVRGPENHPAAAFLREGLRTLCGVAFDAQDAPRAMVLEEGEIPELGPDGYVIHIDGADIYLRGNLQNAVCALLEEDFGWRYYDKNRKASSPGGAVSRATVAPRRYVPPFFQRSVYSAWSRDDEWATANRARLGTFGRYLVHTFFTFVPFAEFRADHPEYFALVGGKRIEKWQDGQLCLTNPDVARIVAERANKVLDKDPSMDFIAISPSDANGPCECPGCAAVLKEEKEQSGVLLRFVNVVAAEIAKRHPDVLVVTEAYRHTLKPPALARPAANVVVRLCLDRRIADYPFFFVEETPDKAILEEWRRKTDRLLVWDYITNFRHYLMPRADLPVLERNVRHYRDSRVHGVMLQTNYSNLIGTLAAMRAWVGTKLLWNPDWSARALAEDYLRGFWGEAAAPGMLAYNDLLIREWEAFHAAHKPGATFVFSDAFYGEARAALEQVRAALAETDAGLLEELDREALTLDYYRLEQGVKAEGEIPDFLALVEAFGKKLSDMGINHVLEGGYNRVAERLEQYADGARMFAYRATQPADRVILPATWNVYASKTLVEDASSLVGRAVRQPNDGNWGVQWRFVDFPALTQGRWRVSIRVRGDKQRPEGRAAAVGVYNSARSAYALTKEINAKDIDADEYRWLDCGVFERTSDSMFLYTATYPDGALRGLYVDAISFAPVKP